MKIILHSACDDGYVPLLLEMMESLGDKLQKYDFGLLDLGLSDSSIKQIRNLKPDVIIKQPQWFIDLPKHRQNVFSQATTSRPFMREVFPNYDGYIQMDADLWFLDSSAIDDYIKAGEKTGFSIIAEWHPTLPRVSISMKPRQKLFNKSKFKIDISYVNLMANLFGKEKVAKLGMVTPICCGMYFLRSDSPVWEAWQEALKEADWVGISKKQRTCDQTCLLYALHKYDLPRTYMMMEHNWIMFPDRNEPLADKERGKLLDPIYPHTPLKVLHIGGKYVDREFTLQTTEGDTIKTKLTRTELLRHL